MATPIDLEPGSDRELVLARILNAPRKNVFRAWTDPEILPLWFAPTPWSTPRAELDVRPGGASLIVMADPEGKEYPNMGVYLEVIENHKIVTTDAYVSAWEPSQKPFMTLVLTLEDADKGGTRYIARVLHWSKEDRNMHRKMGFYEGWGQCAEQLESVAASL